jgi:two-component system, OmpR family, response regulator
MSNRGSKKVLIVEDDPDQLMIRSLLIAHRGLTSLQANGPQAALQMATAERPACAVMDLRMPDEKAGLQLIRELKALDPALKIVVLTGQKSAAFKALPEFLMVEAVFEKGSPTGPLFETIRRLCQ